MEHLRKSGLHQRPHTHFYVFAVVRNVGQASHASQACKWKTFFEAFLPGVEFRWTTENGYEYGGMRMVYDVGRRIKKENLKDTLVMYFHSKGLTRPPEYAGTARTGVETHLMDAVVCRWREHVKCFKYLPSVEALAYTCHPRVLWFNFWCVRASHVVRLPEPVRLPLRKYHWEMWPMQGADLPCNAMFNVFHDPTHGLYSVGSWYDRGCIRMQELPCKPLDIQSDMTPSQDTDMDTLTLPDLNRTDLKEGIHVTHHPTPAHPKRTASLKAMGLRFWPATEAEFKARERWKAYLMQRIHEVKKAMCKRRGRKAQPHKPIHKPKPIQRLTQRQQLHFARRVLNYD